MIACINLSSPRYKAIEVYDNIMFDYKMKYTKEQIKMHKKIGKIALYMMASFSIKYAIMHYASLVAYSHITHDTNSHSSTDDMFKNINDYSTDSYKNLDKSVNNIVDSSVKHNIDYSNHYWDSMSKSVDDALRPSLSNLDNLPKIKLNMDWSR